ncbi:putative neural Wiskott-Aldrich syndrome protein [Apostichopus japonicus]|uniref:Putative neural Wiskott-Aldrich syndrome protein n=1 Tax=Stichopus japonicus TaxID=307972 RepID=A0A2G8K8L1_STIJA|nr:putative neural Wiskott-Aldrich syndrome protein [Apostichopus japonicus]
MLTPFSGTFASAVVQIFRFGNSNNNSNYYNKTWTKQCCGVACFVKDHQLRSFFFRVYDIMSRTKIFEHELYHHFVYNRRQAFFHDFEGEDYWIGLNFANDTEGEIFNDAVQKHLLIKRQRKKGLRRAPPPTPPPQSVMMSIPAPPAKPEKSNKKNKDIKKKKKHRISAADITGPSNFVHLSHVGYGDSSQTYDDDIREWCKNVGLADNVQEKQLEFIKTWVQQRGGLEFVKKQEEIEKEKEKEKKTAFSVSTRKSSKRGPPPPVPTSFVSPPSPNRGPPPPLPSNSAPSPPPSSRGSYHLNQRPHSMHSPSNYTTLVREQVTDVPSRLRLHRWNHPNTLKWVVSTIITANATTAATTATSISQYHRRWTSPTSPTTTPPPTKPPSDSGFPSPPRQGESRGRLLSEIQSGVTLKPAASVSNNVDARSSLLDQIRGGFALKPVEDRDSDGDSESTHSDEFGSMGAALRQALEKRDQAIRGNSDGESEESDEYDSDDWDD